MRGVLFDGKRAEVVDDLEVREPGPGLTPTSSRKRRVNVRTDMASWAAMSRNWIG